MFTVGCEARRSSASAHGRSSMKRGTPLRRFQSASLVLARVLANELRARVRVSGRTFSNQPSMAGVLPSGETSVCSACTRRHTGASTIALLEEWMSRAGPRPQRSPLATSSHSMMPLAPRLTVTPPVVGILPAGRNEHALAALQRGHDVRAAARSDGSAGCRFLPRLRQTSTRFTGGVRPAARNACSAARKQASGPFWFTAPRPMMTRPCGPIDDRGLERRRGPFRSG